MSKADQFRQNAEQAMRWARQSKSEKEKLALIDLAHTWIHAAIYSESTMVGPPEHKVIQS